MAVEIALLGEVTARVDGRPVDLGPARQRCVLAALAVDAGRLVPADRLVERVWGSDTPRRGRATLHSHISRLRGAFAGAPAVVHRSGGYTLVVDQAEHAVDLLRFRALRDRARRTDDVTDQVALLTEALALWRGDPLTGVSGLWVEGERDRWQQERWAAELDLVDARLGSGQGEELVAQLSARTARHPLDERVAGQYMLALHRAGRTADALAHYRRLRERLVEELGTDPGTALRDLHRRILATDPALVPSPVAFGGGNAAKAEEPVPRQLPAPPRWFTGRGAELGRLDEALTAEGPPPSGTQAAAAVVISAIGGAGGIGKTWLALAWGHRHLDRFPDGHLFTDLRGFTPAEQPVAPDAALFGFLTALGVAPDRVPTDLDAKAALYRSLVAGRRMLVVLDNAATAEQVVPLLPGSPTCTVLVTGRTRLASLIDRHGARHLQLDVLAPAEARALLSARLGADRVAAEPGAVDELADLCGRYPLALSITARDAATRPRTPLAEVAAELRELGLEMLDHDTDPAASLPAVLSWSLRRLTDHERTAFGLLGIAPGPDTDVPATASLTGLPHDQARKVLRVLTEHSLLDRRPHGRYAMHDLVRAYAATTARDDLPESARRAALERVVDFYRHTAHAAERLLNPHRDPIRLDPPVPGVLPHPLPDYPAALAWLDTHHPHLLAAQHTAAAQHRHQAVWHLAWTLTTFHWRRGHRHDELDTWQAAADAAGPVPDLAARALRLLGRAHANLGRHEQALEHLHHALALAEHHHDPAQQAYTHHTLAWVWEQRGDDRRALEHARRALFLLRALDQPAAQAVALSTVGWYAARLGDYDTARDHCRQALAHHRRHHHPDGEADTLDSLGFIDHHTGHHHQAVRHYQQALTLRRTHGNTTQAADTLDRLGHPYTALGRHAHARQVWSEALELYREQGRDDDAKRVRRQLDDLAPAPESIMPSDAGKTAENG
ncbi:AfsR/SARP family transcriptional regulator [Saccharothrix luteola]|uniref:AfsR/SARP family transcriptional regulator n=1 Tax=Saccharothrix luteola TaxID=2893018 RepID=UPI001E434DA6|nr:BTAD domain-containing putative transcriptional regulator [Saccharothrix luteola]MCC8246420.1 tetratricopeptide repeat protein [Saccharothrix luteola]